MNSYLWEIDTLTKAIEKYLNLIRKLKEKPDVNYKQIDNIQWKVLDLTLKLNEKYDKKYREELEKLENMDMSLNSEQDLLHQELFKREAILELSRKRERFFESLFDLNFPEEKELYELFDDIRKQQTYERTFHELDFKLVKEQIDLVAEKRKEEHALNEELQNNLETIKKLEESIMEFQKFNAEMNEIFERYIKINGIYKIDVVAAWMNKNTAMETVISYYEEKRLTGNEQNIDDAQYKNAMRVIEESNELLFNYDLAQKMRKPVNNYEELDKKLKEIVEMTTKREKEVSLRNPNMQYPNNISRRRMFFMNLAQRVEKQINIKPTIEKLKKRNQEIEKKLEILFDDVKGLREINKIITGKDVKPKFVEEIELEEESNKNNDNVTIVEEKELASKKDEDEVLEVKQVEKAKPSLLEKLKEKKSALINFIKNNAAAIIATGVLVSLFALGSISDKDVQLDKPAAAVVQQSEQKNESLSANDLLAVIEELEQKEIAQTIGDRISVNNGVKYYTNAAAAQLDTENYVTGRNGLQADKYFINRIAIMEKDTLGKPTGKILAVSSTPGVSAKELAKTLGLKEGQYEVMIHIGTGDKYGNYIEAPINAPSIDDRCWMKADDPGIKIVTPALEMLKESGKGMTR